VDFLLRLIALAFVIPGIVFPVRGAVAMVPLR
jgi:hypothetical protein